jgi:hypothetical protein
MLGFSAALTLWAFELGKSLAGLDRTAQSELMRLRVEVGQLREEREGTQSIANTAGSLLKAEKAAQEQLVQRLKQIESENAALKADLAFYERLLPAASNSGLNVRALRADIQAPGQLRFQVLVMQIGRTTLEFTGRYDVVMTGSLDGRPWSSTQAGGSKPLNVKQSLRLEGMIDVPLSVVVKQIQFKVLDGQGAVKASQTAKL